MATAKELKEEGNRHFLSRKYGEAIGFYSKAILKSDNVSTFYTNRALCYLKLKDWDRALADCRRALELNKSSVKAYYFLGEAYLELDSFEEAITNLQRAFHLAKDQKQHFGDDIAGMIRRVKKRRFEYQEEKRVNGESELQTYLIQLIEEDQNRQLENADGCLDNETIEDIKDQHKEKITGVKELFRQAEEKRKKREVPDSLCGKISFEVMREPVITPSGITYDRKSIEEHLQRVGHFDPVTGTPLTTDKLIPNLIMKEVIDNYLEENPWAEDY